MKLTEIAFFTKDVKGTADFYRALFQIEPVAESEGMSIFMSGETKIFIHRDYEPGEGELPPENHIAFTVTDVDAACQGLAEQGISIEVHPAEYYLNGIRMLLLVLCNLDPCGRPRGQVQDRPLQDV